LPPLQAEPVHVADASAPLPMKMPITAAIGSTGSEVVGGSTAGVISAAASLVVVGAEELGPNGHNSEGHVGLVGSALAAGAPQNAAAAAATTIPAPPIAAVLLDNA
jgi:hypothetical protein